MSTRRFNRSRRLLHSLSIVSLTAIALCSGCRPVLSGQATDASTAMAQSTFPDPTADSPTSTGSPTQTAVFAGGCFWGMEAVFEHLQGVSDVVSGFSGGTAATAQYERVSSGGTDHAEAVKITYDPTQISYGQLLKIYFSVAHNPTELNRQGPDVGPQYRSAIFFATQEQRQIAQAYIDQLNQAKIFNHPIVTQLEPLSNFYEAEEYHQNFIDRNPTYPYVVIHDMPKLERLKQQFPNLYVESTM